MSSVSPRVSELSQLPTTRVILLIRAIRGCFLSTMSCVTESFPERGRLGHQQWPPTVLARPQQENPAGREGQVLSEGLQLLDRLPPTRVPRADPNPQLQAVPCGAPRGHTTVRGPAIPVCRGIRPRPGLDSSPQARGLCRGVRGHWPECGSPSAKGGLMLSPPTLSMGA